MTRTRFSSTNPLSAATAMRRAGVMICVLVVLLIIGLLTLQSTRMLMATVRADRSRTQLEQMKELIELGRMRLQAKLASDKTFAGETLEVSVPSESKETDQSTSSVASLTILHLKSNETSEPSGWRIVVRFPAGKPNESTASWESRK